MRLGLVGYPIQHSLSPWIHKRFLHQLNLEGSYQLFETEKEQFSEMINYLRKYNVNGFNVTVPYKQQIIPYLDHVDGYAEEIGAVNTVVSENGVWVGYNTDGIGYTLGLKHAYPSLFVEKKKVLIIGAGGAARGIYHALCESQFEHVDIANRTLSKANSLSQLNKSSNVQTDILTFEEAEKNIGDYQLIVQTTSVGMNEDRMVLSLDNLKRDTIVSDIVYQPLLTMFLQQAKDKGASIHQGHTMLLYQAKLAFEKWSGKEVVVQGIMKEFERFLKKE